MNNQMKFDPMTGKPIENTTTPEVQQDSNETQTQQNMNSINDVAQLQTQLNNIPNVEQNKQDFINNVQAMNPEKKEEKKENNLIFIIILFIALLGIIYFLFPIIFKNL